MTDHRSMLLCDASHFTCDRLPGKPRLAREACGKRHVEAKKRTRIVDGDHAMSGPETCARCRLGAEHAGIPFDRGPWRYADLVPGTVVAGLRIVDEPRPYSFGGGRFVYAERLSDGYRKAWSVDWLRARAKREEAGRELQQDGVGGTTRGRSGA